ncbi:MAG: hypothetical protein V4596_12205 [Bdellovibrionota bacterium]
MKTLEVFVPVVGAILFSVYMLLRYVYAEAPKEIFYEETVVILHDKYTGRLYSMDVKTVDDKLDPTSFYGLNNIDTIGHFNKLKSFKINEDLVDTNPGYRSDFQINTILNTLEFSFFYWLANLNNPKWSTQTEIHHGISMATSKFKDMLSTQSETKINLSKVIKHNKLVEAFETLDISLPSNSTITAYKDINSRKVVIDSKYSTIEYTMSYAGGGMFQAGNKVSQKIALYLGLDTSNPDRHQSHNFITSWKFNIKPWRRDSKEGSVHPSWFDRISKSYSRSFSWEKIEQRYQ